jgi:hypothetical protein
MQQLVGIAGLALLAAQLLAPNQIHKLTGYLMGWAVYCGVYYASTLKRD